MDKDTTELAKKAAAELAVKENVRKDMILGIGSGSTIVYVVKMIEKMDREIKSSFAKGLIIFVVLFLAGICLLLSEDLLPPLSLNYY